MASQINKKKQEEKIDTTERIKTKFEPYDGDEPFLFVSYSHEDDKIVYPMLDELFDKKYRIWYDDTIETGTDFRQILREKIQTSEGVLLFVSEKSMASQYCGMEIIVACESGKKLFPIRLDDAPIPAAFKMLLESTQHVIINDRNKALKALTRDLPAEAMDRLTKTDDGKLEKCEDNGNSIDVGEEIKEICDKAFKNRRALHEINLPSTLQIIGNESFRGCSNLEKMVIPEKVSRIGESAFRDCVNMKKLVLQNDLIKIGERAFENCSDLDNIILPDGLTEIYGGVFNSCKSLKSINLPKNLTILGESAFSDCEALETISIPEGTTKIDDLVFNGCKKLEKIELNEGLRKIGKSAFKNCESLKEVYIPSTVNNIGDAPFRGCKGLKSIKVDPKNKFYKSETNGDRRSDREDRHILFNKNKSVIISYPANSTELSYYIPDSVTCISNWTFCDCKRLGSIVIPDSVNEIGEGAFCNCQNLDLVEIPDSVTKIDDCAFRGCTGMTEIKIPSSVTDLGWGIFDGCETNVVVKCQINSEIYKYCEKHNIKTDTNEENFE